MVTEAPNTGGLPPLAENSPGPSWTLILRRAVREFGRDGCTDLAAALTYFGVLSLFPAILALVSILGLIGNAKQTTEALMGVLGAVMQGPALDVVRGAVSNVTTSPAAGWTFFLGIVAALWSAGGYVGAFGRAMNKVYGVEEGRSGWKLRLSTLALTVLVVVLVAMMAVLLVVSGPVARALGDAIGAGSAVVVLWQAGKWPVLGIAAVVLVAILYQATPNFHPPRWRWLGWGAACALLLLIATSIGFGFYVVNFSSYEKTFGTIAGAIILLLWLWICNLALLFGAELDAEIERGRELRAGLDAHESLVLEPRSTTTIATSRRRQRDEVAAGEPGARRWGNGQTVGVVLGASSMVALWGYLQHRWEKQENR
ncbi:YihY/virulence factor BrkB family protein [Specibacter cremeus]|uniref:YihY/virulence factor BrkB family protein n=1 Tax=Specibacter cremeus TaxID=1629051 RepID=UPI000F7B48E8|nr:YihY/virulence factor BrkB family protein [Specibacter cremeus]